MGYAVDPRDKNRLGLPPCPPAREPAFCKRAANRGFTLIELLITIAIILTICAIAVPNLLAALDQAKMAKAVGDIRAIGDDIDAYDLSNGQFPTTLADINRDTFPDPWGNPYQYLNFADTKGKGECARIGFSFPSILISTFTAWVKMARAYRPCHRKSVRMTLSGQMMAITSGWHRNTKY